MLNKNQKLTIFLYREDGEVVTKTMCDRIKISYNNNTATLFIKDMHNPLVLYEMETIKLQRIVEIK